jgi:hypothetical protein
MIKGRFEMRYILFLTLPLLLCAKTTFITQEEYAAQLYKNPRGIGCQHCHGIKGEGKTVAKYMHKGVEKSFRGSEINHLDYTTFYNALSKRIDSMPRYFLTSKEVSALYFYLNEEELKKAKDAKKAKEEKEKLEAKKLQEAKEIKAISKIKDVKEINTTQTIEKATAPQAPQKAEKIQEIPASSNDKEIQEAPEIKETPEAVKEVDINALFKEATEGKNGK